MKQRIVDLALNPKVRWPSWAAALAFWAIILTGASLDRSDEPLTGVWKAGFMASTAVAAVVIAWGAVVTGVYIVKGPPGWLRRWVDNAKTRRATVAIGYGAAAAILILQWCGFADPEASRWYRVFGTAGIGALVLAAITAFSHLATLPPSPLNPFVDLLVKEQARYKLAFIGAGAVACAGCGLTFLHEPTGWAALGLGTAIFIGAVFHVRKTAKALLAETEAD